MEVIRLENVSKVYGKGKNAVTALNTINLNVQSGEFVAIVGSSGSGKSTLLHTIGGLNAPTEGKVKIEGEFMYSLSDEALSILRRRKIGFIFQSFNLVPILNVEENIQLPVLLDHQKVDHAYYDEIINYLDIKDKLYASPSNLSGGQQQRVAIARALIHRPSYILADEPTGNLDSQTSNDVIDLLQLTAKKYKQTLLIITHDMKIAERASRIIQIEDGSIQKDMSYH
ncbi:ABC transporter ATP-binding protein [Priestia filamentosa]|uniref:Peptide ABC transporter ATP-binding protein n=1 Tax=Priestia filamentosa TaxID=1402861 RepID=A0A1X7G1X1_9BACI|nr:ABC transporter ATP-binding protein [Priestia filamentosa]AKO92128.1 peptide ABC transporter ATP-binding protein [Priestia filamentosa]MDT3762138.1 ABC transporter ATP-binding protein [Priestia filamentosa]OXS65881.1 peptide ABC transporter ATP-binding protein [Priestia filamentosa]RJS64584.1 ABC transporter ATP-binding protein [Priestia filamentosa]WCM17222.1 ABC transporter ATP-binding protein [Priestia filamentosa]